jgi:hypothetical protein
MIHPLLAAKVDFSFRNMPQLWDGVKGGLDHSGRLARSQSTHGLAAFHAVVMCMRHSRE